MKSKTTKIIYWIATGLLALFNISGIFFINSPQAVDAMKHLEVPLWFHTELTIGKCIGGLILILPMIPKRIKEWAYVAFGIDMLSAMIAMVSVDGPQLTSFEPLLFFAILLVSYISYHKLYDNEQAIAK
ncbi:MAG TPA: DoxX family protein [Puia sp.]|jgi:hypothetical protein|nr:DoxX family protein [Puia sp.]